MSGFGASTTVVFNSTALLYKEGEKLKPMPHVVEVLKFLLGKKVRLISSFRQGERAEQSLKDIELLDFFVVDGAFRSVCPMQEDDRARALNLQPFTFWKALKNLGIATNDGVAAVTGHFQEIKEARASGITKVVGFYGSPSISLGRIFAEKGSLERDVVPLSGTAFTTSNLREVPEMLGYHRY
ncbi:MAG: hypothetical protein R3D88_01475 [Alphaproteobacteria bacterium]